MNERKRHRRKGRRRRRRSPGIALIISIVLVIIIAVAGIFVVWKRYGPSNERLIWNNIMAWTAKMRSQ